MIEEDRIDQLTPKELDEAAEIHIKTLGEPGPDDRYGCVRIMIGGWMTTS